MLTADTPEYQEMPGSTSLLKSGKCIDADEGNCSVMISLSLNWTLL